MDNTFPPPPPGSTPSPYAPPPIIAPNPPRASRGRGWMIFAIILIILLCFSLFGNLILSAVHLANLGNGFQTTATHQAGPQLEEAIIKDNDSHNKIAVITVDGVISGSQADQAGNNMVEVIKAELASAKNDDKVRAVILKVDSPGGEVLASDDIYRAIRKFQSDSSKPVICSMGSLAASGGYYISSPCNWIVANRLTITGSIGVIMETVNYRGLMDKIGVEPVVFKSGKYKDMLSGMRETNEIPDGERAMVQDFINQTYGQFKGVVADGRKAAYGKSKSYKDECQPLSEDWTNYADGRILSGDQALKLGLVDEIGDFQAAVDRAESIANIHNANLIEYNETYDISNFLHLFGQSSQAARGVKLDLGFDLPKMQAGECYFLYMPSAD